MFIYTLTAIFHFCCESTIHFASVHINSYFFSCKDKSHLPYMIFLFFFFLIYLQPCAELNYSERVFFCLNNSDYTILDFCCLTRLCDIYKYCNIKKKPSTKKNKSYVGCKKGINPLNTIKAIFIWQILLFVEQIIKFILVSIISLIIKLINIFGC